MQRMRLNADVLTAGNHPVQGWSGGSAPFRQRWPWLGGDLQTLRDTLRVERLPQERSPLLAVPVGGSERLAVRCDPPMANGEGAEPRGLVVVLHGLGGHSGRQGVRRLGWLLQRCGFAVWRPNLRGAGPGRELAAGTYAAACNRDLLPLLAEARRRAGGLPLLGAGLSLGGTVLLNALLEQPGGLDGLACVSSPLDLEACSARIAAPRNRIYARWLLRRLIEQTVADPGGLTAAERTALLGGRPPGSIRDFDAAITAPRWGYGSVEEYYAAASPLPALLQPGTSGAGLPPALILQADDDPWVPAEAAHRLAGALAAGAAAVDRNSWQVLITRHGGHNGFHGRGDQGGGSWSDRCVAAWLLARAAAAASGDGPAARP
ncbi:MAG: hypothetical protein RLZZ124_1378 [Cyanobacteriota bacterium]|jgi:predicted alpha/beta-fold hydrolase